VVVDIGNSRIKWGRCRAGQVDTAFASLPGDSTEAWNSQLESWQFRGKLTWAAASVRPSWQRDFTAWAEGRGDRVLSLAREHIPLQADVEEPGAVGLDRLLNGLAASRRVAEGTPAIIVSVGTAVTVDLLREDGAFAGGAIFPGPRLMAESLHQFTAKLPLVELDRVRPSEPPGRNTRAAIQAGISSAIMGGVSLLVSQMAAARESRVRVFLTGGALGELGRVHFGEAAATEPVPTLTLEGIRIAVESLP
jgi:type III pantothenate kinase